MQVGKYTSNKYNSEIQFGKYKSKKTQFGKYKSENTCRKVQVGRIVGKMQIGIIHNIATIANPRGGGIIRRIHA